MAANGVFVESWRTTKGTLELWSEIQTTLVKNLNDLNKEIAKYHDELVKSRKKLKEQEVIDAVNLMQTTTTCLQKVSLPPVVQLFSPKKRTPNGAARC